MDERRTTTCFMGKLILIGLISTLQLSLFFHTTNAAGYIIKRRPYARSLQGMIYYSKTYKRLSDTKVIY